MLSNDQIILRLLLAAALGGVVGLERERLEWAAGLRTHMLVCLGSALLMIVSTFGFADILGTPNVTLDPSRVAAQVVSGIGFLGAGTILFLRQEVIRGLTTAASLWTVAAVGLAAGCGLYLAAIWSTAVIVLILALLKPLERRLFRRHLGRQVTIVIDRQRVSILQVEAALDAAGLQIGQLTMKRGQEPAEDWIQFTLTRGATQATLLSVATSLQAVDGVQEVRL